jgi:hypothetical protein
LGADADVGRRHRGEALREGVEPAGGLHPILGGRKKAEDRLEPGGFGGTIAAGD